VQWLVFLQQKRHPEVCSPSRSVVSIISIFLFPFLNVMLRRFFLMWAVIVHLYFYNRRTVSSWIK
jgi:hypothetical protein